MALVWQHLNTLDPVDPFWGEPVGRRVASLYRTQVPGGWLVFAKTVAENLETGFSGLTFLPDPEHKWDGNSVGPLTTERLVEFAQCDVVTVGPFELKVVSCKISTTSSLDIDLEIRNKSGSTLGFDGSKLVLWYSNYHYLSSQTPMIGVKRHVGPEQTFVLTISYSYPWQTPTELFLGNVGKTYRIRLEPRAAAPND